MNKYLFQAVIFDLDGVITKTALVHSASWKEMFNDYLRYRDKEYGEAFREFTHIDDYLPFVDGKPRYKGVASFLESRGIDIPFGDPSDPGDRETVCGLGNKKNDFFNSILDRDGVEVYESTVQLVKDLKKAGIRIGVASSSKNCEQVLETAGLMDYFETRVDGVVSAEIGLQGKPEPDIFTTACDNLGVEYEGSVVVEDAVSGVQAGRKGNFGLTLGVAREGNQHELKINGADIVVEDLEEIGGLEGINDWFVHGLEREKWSISFHDYDTDKEKSREALLTTGNGYFGTRGAMEESQAGKFNYPGTYMAGLFNRRTSKVAGRDIENEDFVNCPNWLPLSFKPEGGNWFEPNTQRILNISRRLDFRNGLLCKEITVEDEDGRQTLVRSKRIVSMANPEMAAISYSINPLNYSGAVTFKASLNGAIINEGVERYRQLDQKHLEAVSEGGKDNLIYVQVRTNQSGIIIAEAARLDVYTDDKKVSPSIQIKTEPAYAEASFSIEVELNQIIRLEKLVSIKNSIKDEGGDLLGTVKSAAASAGDFSEIEKLSQEAWDELWNKADICIEGDRYAQKLVRMHIYHLFVTTSPHNSKLDFGIPPRGLHGEAYRGHIFWDELYILPFYNIHLPEVSRAVLHYRYKRLDKAREYALEYGYGGAMYPWQSGSDGREETQIVHLNPVSGEWGEDYSSLQRHISIAIAYNIWQYYWTAADDEFICGKGGEIFFEICRFWISKTSLNEDGRYSIDKVMGPDEFHESYPGATEGGLRDNAYTNIMVAWLLRKAFWLVDEYGNDILGEMMERISLGKKELSDWKVIAGKLKLVISNEGIISQFDGYFDLEELDWEAYRAKYDNIHRLDRILKAEGKSPDDYKLAKQPDTLMCFYALDRDIVAGILEDLGYDPVTDLLERNFDYYIERCSHGSTLSRIVHACLASQIGKPELAWNMYMEALESDLVDIQGGTTGEGIHAGVMGGTLMYIINSIAGISFHEEYLRIKPNMIARWKKISFDFAFRKNYYTFEISSSKLKLVCDNADTVNVEVNGKNYKTGRNHPLEIDL